MLDKDFSTSYGSFMKMDRLYNSPSIICLDH